MRIPALVLLTTLGSAGFVSAQPIIAQLSGLASPSQVIDFGAGLFPNFTNVSTEFPGITITHARYFTTGVSNNLVGGFLTNDFSGAPDTLSIQFVQPITDLSFVYHQIGTSAPSTIRALLFGVTVDSFSGSWNQSQPNNYFGFTNTVFDELQIDFVGDFNVDTLALSPALPSAAACNTFNGTNVNPVDFTCTTLPVLGTTWQGAVATNANTLLTAVAYAPGGIGTPLPLFGGELLLQLSPPLTVVTGGATYSLAIPSSMSFLGQSYVFQGLRLDIVAATPTFVPLNGIELVLGL